MQNHRKIEPFFVDNRGEMFNLIDKDVKIKSVLLLSCKKGSIRANHFHKKDSHYSFMIRGKMEYSSKDLGSKQKPKKIIVKSGEIIYSPPMKIHAMKFLEDSLFLALATESREQNFYEKDTVRIKII